MAVPPPTTCSACGQTWYAGVESECIKRGKCGFKVKSPRIVRFVAWVEIMGKRAETTFDVESPWVCDGACPELQKQTDQSVANWVFQSHAKSGFTVSPLSKPNVLEQQPAPRANDENR